MIPTAHIMMNAAFPISVVIPAYRVSSYIGQALESVLGQTHAAAEIIVVNDGCPDTESMERAIAPYSKTITYIKQPNGGPAAARNTGIRASGYDWVAFLDGDDYWAPIFLERQLAFLSEHPHVDLVYSDAWYVTNDGDVLTRLMKNSPSHGDATLLALLNGSCTIATSTVLVRKSSIEDVGLFDEHLGNYSEDFDLWLRIAHSGAQIAYTTVPLAYHRIHPESLTAVPLNLPRAAIQTLLRARDRMDLADAEIRAVDRRIAAIKSDILVEEAKQLVVDMKYEAAYLRLRESTRHRFSIKRSLTAQLVRLAPSWLRQQLLRRKRTTAASTNSR